MKVYLLPILMTFGFVMAQNPFPVSLERPFPSLNLTSITEPTTWTSLSPRADAFLVGGQDGSIYMFDSSNMTLSKVYNLPVYYNQTLGLGLIGMTFNSNTSAIYFFYTSLNSSTTEVHLMVSFVFYSIADGKFGNLTTVLDVIDAGAGNIIGGLVAFGPDGYLYIGVGDAEWSMPEQINNNSQNTSNLFGKILRVEPLPTGGYQIPSGNPFVRSSVTAPEIYAFGLRQPWRFSWDSKGNLWCPDVGLDSWEEINIITPGANYGWPIYEGTQCHSPPCTDDPSMFTFPIYQYPHNASLAINGVFGEAIIGGYVYEGSDAPDLIGQYIFADIILGKIFALNFSSTNFSDNSARVIFNSTFFPIQFLQVENRLYLLKRGSLAPGAPSFVNDIVFIAEPTSQSSQSDTVSRPTEIISSSQNVGGIDSSSPMLITCAALTIAAIVITL